MRPLRRRHTTAAFDRDDLVRVLFVHTATDPTLGADTWVQSQIIRGLDKRTHQIHVACVPGLNGDPTPTFEAIEDIDGVLVVPAHPGPSRPDPRSLRSLIRMGAATLGWLSSIIGLALLLVRSRIDVIHTSDRPRDAFVSVLIGRLTRTPSIVHTHVLYGDWMSRMLRWSLAHCDHVIAVSSFVANGVIGTRRDAARVHVVLNAIDPNAWHPGLGRNSVREELGIPPTAPVVVTVCRLFDEKGTLPLIEAVASARELVTDVRLVVVGAELDPNAGYLERLKAAVDQRGLDSAVTFTGRRSDVEALMAAADVFAMPSFEEPFGLVFLEAMAMCLPVVALDNGGTREVVQHGFTGLLSDPGDQGTLDTNLTELLSDPAERNRMGRNGRDTVVAEFTIDRMAADVAAVYRLVVSGTKTCGRT